MQAFKQNYINERARLASCHVSIRSSSSGEELLQTGNISENQHPHFDGRQRPGLDLDPWRLAPSLPPFAQALALFIKKGQKMQPRLLSSWVKVPETWALLGRWPVVSDLGGHGGMRPDLALGVRTPPRGRACAVGCSRMRWGDKPQCKGHGVRYRALFCPSPRLRVSLLPLSRRHCVASLCSSVAVIINVRGDDRSLPAGQ